MSVAEGNRMTWIRIGASRIIGLFHRREDELNAELRLHFEMLVGENLSKGQELPEARANAMRSLGGVDQMKESYRDQRGIPFIESLLRDLHLGWRQAARSPGFTLMVVASLALGIGSSTAVFSVVNAVLLRPLPYRSASNFVAISERTPKQYGALIAPLDFLAWRSHREVMESATAWGVTVGENLSGGNQPVRAQVARVTPDMFKLLGVAPALGRPLAPEEGQPGRGNVAVISQALWRKQFDGSSKVLGRAILLDASPYTVVGVMPAAFRPLEGRTTDIWIPLSLSPSERTTGALRGDILQVIGRLRPGVTTRQLQSVLQNATEGVNTTLSANGLGDREGLRVTVEPLREELVEGSRPQLILLGVAAALLLGIACINVANLLLARGCSRAKEITIIRTMGAPAWRITRQLLSESILLSLLGGAAGLALALGLVRGLRAFVPEPLSPEVSIDWRVLLFTVTVAILSGIVFGLAPAWSAHQLDLNAFLKTMGSQASSTFPQRRIRSALMVAEVALCMLLLSGAGLLARSFLVLLHEDLGFDRHDVITADVWLPLNDLYPPSRQRAEFSAILDRVRNIPGILIVSAAEHPPLTICNRLNTGLTIQGASAEHTERPYTICSVAGDYFRALGIAILGGREFTEKDGMGAPLAGIITHSMAEEYFPGENPVGKLISLESQTGPWMTIVGVVADQRNYRLEKAPWPELYVPFLQDPTPAMTLVLKVNRPAEKLLPAIQKQVQAVDPSLPVFAISTIDEQISTALAKRRLQLRLLGIFGFFALILAAAGIFGVVSYNVSQRTYEIGVRMAIGASRSDVLEMVLRRQVILTLVGILAGLIAAAGLTGVVSRFLYGTHPLDLATLLIVGALLLLVTVLASFLPARRASRIDPLAALRWE
jgi:putative ABC transport system permease protein